MSAFCRTWATVRLISSAMCLMGVISNLPGEVQVLGFSVEVQSWDVWLIHQMASDHCP